jgi:uncharacterized protein (UPF0264 family)
VEREAGDEPENEGQVNPKGSQRGPYALSLKQPWATLLVHGLKTIEVRRWTTKHRGPLLIHAAGVSDERPEGWARLPDELREHAELCGGIVGVGTLVECKRYRTAESFRADQSHHLNEPDWFEPAGLFGLRFTDLRPLPYRAYPGWMRLFSVSDSESAEEQNTSPTCQRGDASSSLATRLLVSVRSAAEVEPALAGGAALVDVKEPDNGGLGAPTEETVRTVLAAVGGRVPVSAAMGEQSEFHRPSSELAGCSFLKWGPAGLRTIQAVRAAHEQNRHEVAQAVPGAQVVLVGYADWRRADAPPAEEVCGLACQLPGSVLLLDTFTKEGGRSLLDFLPLPRVSLLCRLCRSAGVRVALAGSLERRHLEELLPARPDWFAVRGAVCGGGRTGRVEERRVRELTTLLNSLPAG